MTRDEARDLSLGGEFPVVPPDPLYPDVPLPPPAPDEISPPGSGCGTVGLVVAIAVLILGVASYMAMLARVGAR